MVSWNENKVLVVGAGRDVADVNEWEFGTGAGMVCN